MATSKAFAAVNTLPKADKKVINPRATRYGLIPIWDVPTLAKDFYVWRIPANTVFPFRPFTGETGYDINNKVLYSSERMPQEQVLDMYNATEFFIELEPLAKLGDEVKAEQVVSVLANPTACDKYPNELGHECATCWLKDVFTRADDRIKDAFKEDAELRKTAKDCVGLIRDGLSKAIEEARRRVDVAVREIDDPKSGKTMFYPADYSNVYHTHNDRPVYKTSVNRGSEVGTQIAEAIRELTRKDEPVPTVDIAGLVSKAVAEATQELRDQLAAYQFKEPAKEVLKDKPSKKD